ncbi:MAG: hypothetical protein C0507_11825 [Cyanobacteria bacterium PR.3.49]|jgi:hypothetical protein|nr:hypothetical protein [Cyanobacteria bacterium PR.3.49]
MTDIAEADKPKSGGKWATFSSAVLWIVGFVILFIVPADSPYVWVSDALLLLGFFPLLILWKPSWPWLVFGVLNVVIGFVLLVATYLPVESLTSEMAKARQQLVETKSPYAAVFSEASAAQMAHVHTHVVKQHSPWTWMILGVISTVYGLIRMIKNTIKWIAQKKRTE